MEPMPNRAIGWQNQEVGQEVTAFTCRQWQHRNTGERGINMHSLYTLDVHMTDRINQARAPQTAR